MRRLLLICCAVGGLVFVGSAAHASPNLIMNGDFSAGLAYWTETNSCCYFTDSNGFHEGAVGSNGLLSQTFSDTAGDVLTLSFDYSGPSGYQYVSFDGITVPSSYVGNPSGYQGYTFDLGRATGSDTIVFNGQDDPSYNTLDNVVVTQAPEPASLALLGVGIAGVGLLRRRWFA